MFSFLVPSVSSAFEPVRAEIGQDTAWTGEAVPLIMTGLLHSLNSIRICDLRCGVLS